MQKRTSRVLIGRVDISQCLCDTESLLHSGVRYTRSARPYLAGEGSDCSPLFSTEGFLCNSVLFFFPVLPSLSCARKILALKQLQQSVDEGSGGVTYMEKLKELAFCKPGEEKANGNYHCWLQLPEWIHVFCVTPFPSSSWCMVRGWKTAVTNCTKRNPN